MAKVTKKQVTKKQKNELFEFAKFLSDDILKDKLIESDRMMAQAAEYIKELLNKIDNYEELLLTNKIKFNRSYTNHRALN
jgi:hypothetical protein